MKSCDIGLSSVMLKNLYLIMKNAYLKLKTKEDFVLWLNILDRNIKIGSLKWQFIKLRKVK